jgi:hypothetical protein
LNAWYSEYVADGAHPTLKAAAMLNDAATRVGYDWDWGLSPAEGYDQSEPSVQNGGGFSLPKEQAGDTTTGVAFVMSRMEAARFFCSSYRVYSNPTSFVYKVWQKGSAPYNNVQSVNTYGLTEEEIAKGDSRNFSGLGSNFWLRTPVYGPGYSYIMELDLPNWQVAWTEPSWIPQTPGYHSVGSTWPVMWVKASIVDP